VQDKIFVEMDFGPLKHFTVTLVVILVGNLRRKLPWDNALGHNLTLGRKFKRSFILATFKQSNRREATGGRKLFLNDREYGK
jgi:hypothetical protein